MGRTTKLRTVCMERKMKFVPETKRGASPITMTVEEHETIRLIDYEGLSQHESAAMMDVSRATVQSVYESARYKIADAFMNRRPIVVEGGHYRLCNHGPDVEYCAKNKTKKDHAS